MGLSAHMWRTLKYRTSDECLLEHKEGTFLHLTRELKEDDDICVKNDVNRLDPYIAGASDTFIFIRGGRFIINTLN